jgi:carboxypeptidase family protein
MPKFLAFADTPWWLRGCFRGREQQTSFEVSPVSFTIFVIRFMGRSGGFGSPAPEAATGWYLAPRVILNEDDPNMADRLHCSRLNRWEKIVRLLLIGVVAGALLAPHVQAQSTAAELIGSVKDTSGAMLPGVALTITNESSAQERRLVTDSAGSFVAPSLPVGSYTLKAELANFKTQVRTGIVLQVAQQIRVDLTMEVGDVTQEITVQETVPLLRTANAEVSEVIANQRIVDLPLNGRQFVDLTLLSDNIFVAPRGTRGAALAQTGPAVLVAGQRPGHNMYFLDGVSITDQYFNHLVASPSVDAIQEFNIQKSIYSAEFGGKASATISAATKSGTNALHGSVYEFLRNSAVDARNFFDSSIPPLRQNQFGTTLGGPIRRDKDFFFVNYEGLRERRAVTQTFSVPSDKVRSGDFSGLAPIYDPTSTNPATGARAQFFGNKIPGGNMDPVAVAVLAKLPHANLPGETQNLVAAPTLSNDSNQFSVRIDHRLSVNDSIYGRYYFANYDTFQPFGNGNLNETLVPGFGYSITTKTRNFAFNETHVFSPSLINEFRFGFLRVTGGQESQNQGFDFVGQSGLQGLAPAGNNAGYPNINFSGAYSTAGDPSTLVSRRDNSFDYFENVSWIRGAHSMKFGVYFFRLRFNPQGPPNVRGSFTFSPRFTASAAGAGDGNAFADFLLGYPSSALGGVGGGEEDARSLWSHFYAQDDWRATPRLSVNAGIRYEINGQLSDIRNRLSNIEVNRFVIASNGKGEINPEAAALLQQIPVPYVTSKAAGYNNTLQQPNYHRVAPRLGLAWSVSDKTVVRLGYGLFYNQAAYGIQTALAQNLPFYFNKSVTTAGDTKVPTLKTQTILLSPANGTIGGSGMNHNYRSEYAESWSLNVQRELTSNWVVQATYFGSKVVGADNSTFLNVPEPGPGPVDARRPNPRLSGFKAIRWDGYSNYHSGTVKVEKRMSRGFTFDANYTLSKSMDDASDVGSTFSEINIPQDVRNVRAEKALSSFDHRQRFVFSSSYDLPFGPGHALNPTGWVEKVAAGWRVNATGSFQSGAPFTVNLPNDNANIGSGPAQRPNLRYDPNLDSGQTPQRWFDTTAFATPAQYTFGNTGRNVVRTDGLANIDLSLAKNTRLNEQAGLEFRAEFFNLFNHTNFADVPGRIAFTSNFGRYFSAENPRQIQFALKLSF